YATHKPVTPIQALALAQTSANIGVALVLVLLGGGLGHRLLRLWLGPASPLETSARAILEAALGWGALALIMLLLGAARLYYPALLWVISAALFVWLWSDVRAWLSAVLTLARGLAPEGVFE